jgi:outer membrane protein TolC
MMIQWLAGAVLVAAAPVADVAGDTVPALELGVVVESALRTHPRIVGTAARVEAAEAELGRSRAELLPSVGARGTATRHEEPMVVAPLHGFDPMAPPAFDETLYQGHASAEYTLFDGGGRRSRIRSAEHGLEAARWSAESAEDQVVAEAVDAYLAGLSARDLRRAYGEQVAALESELERTELLLAEGRAPRVAVLRARAALSEARAGLESSDQRLRLALRRIVRISGLPPERVDGAPLVEVAEGAPVPDRATLVARALEGNPALAEARDRAAVAGTAVQAARSAYLPRVSLAGRYSAFGSASTDPALEWQAGVEVSYPLFTGGARSRGVERAAAQARAAEADVRLAARSVADGVDAGLAAYRSARARVEALEAAVAQSAEVSRIEALALETGAGTQTDYLSAEAALLRARAGLAEARHAVIQARVELARATGELDAAWLSRLTEEVER